MGIFDVEKALKNAEKTVEVSIRCVIDVKFSTFLFGVEKALKKRRRNIDFARWVLTLFYRFK